MNTVSYYGRGLLRLAVPYGLANRLRERMLRAFSDASKIEEVEWRVAYYNKLSARFDASKATRIADISRSKSRYFLDLSEDCRGFGPNRRLHYRYGDTSFVPEVPTVVKSRPLDENNANSVLLKLNKLRHFTWSPDPVPFRDKVPAAVWRGTPLNAPRRALVRAFYDHPRFDIGHTRGRVDDLAPKPALSHARQKAYKFFISLEGNDVATNLKWGMASNMLVMSPRPRFETWFMEGRLEPGKHFVPLKDDLSDLEAKVDYFTRHVSEAEDIIRNAHDWIAMFTNPAKERVIAARVLEHYFRLSGQL